MCKCADERDYKSKYCAVIAFAYLHIHKFKISIMCVLIFVDQTEGHIKKSSYEVLTYGVKLAAQIGTTAEALLLGTVNDDLAALGKYGVSKVHQAANETLNHLDAQLYAKVIAEAVQSIGATVVVLSHNQTGKAIAARISARLKAGLVTGAIALPDTSNGFVVKRTVFSGKAFANVKIEVFAI